jgi:hypothetical protein
MWNWSQSGRYTTNTTTRNSCVCVGAGHWKWGSGKENNWVSGWRRRHRTREMADCVFTQLVGPQMGASGLTACPPSQVVPTLQPPVWWSPYSSVGHELTRNTKFEEVFWFFSFFFLVFFWHVCSVAELAITHNKV